MQWAILSFFCCACLKMSGKELNITCIFNITLSSYYFVFNEFFIVFKTVHKNTCRSLGKEVADKYFKIICNGYIVLNSQLFTTFFYNLNNYKSLVNLL